MIQVITRWQNFTGRAAILDGSPKTFDQVKLERQMAEGDMAPQSSEPLIIPGE